MSAPRRFVALLWLTLAGSLPAQNTAPPLPATSPGVAAAADDRAARVAERYRAMLATNPTEGLAFDRLWKYHEERGTTAELLDSYQQAAAKPDADLATLLVNGYLLKKVGKLDEAAAANERANKRDPASPLPWIASAELALTRNQPEEAANGYAQALSKLPATDRRRTDLLLKQGAALLAAGKTTEAAECWEKLVAVNPADLSVRRQLAEVYEKNGFPDRTVAQYEYIEAHADPAARINALRELGRLQEAQGHFDAAREALEQGFLLTSRDNWLHGDLQTRLIHLYQRAGRVPELATRWQAEVAAAPRDLGGYLRLEALAEAEGDAAGERGWLEKIVALAPVDRENTLKLAERLTEAGQRPRAADLYDGLLKRQPANLELILARADLDVQMGQPAAAVSRVETRVAQSPADESIVGPVLNFFLDHRLADAAESILRAEVARQPEATEPSLALAKFLFSERRPADARTVLDALAAQAGTPTDRAARLQQIAEAYHQGAESELALRAWRQASALQPGSPAPLLAAADVLRADGDVPGAAALLEQAILLTPPGAENLAVDRKLFETLRGDEDSALPNPIERALLVGRTGGPGRSVTPKPPAESTLGRYLAVLAATAGEQSTPANYLRLARWLSWAHDDLAALSAAQSVIELDPGNLPARELIASIAVQSSRPELAEQMLSQLLQLDPGHQAGALRQLANLKLAAGDFPESLKLFQRLQQLAPGSRSALADLALAQQRADQWFDALATWERAYNLPGGTPAQREEVRRPLLAVYEHLGEFPQAVGLLLRAVDEQTDFAAKEDLFRQLADFAHKHGLDDRLREDIETRLRGKPDDYFTLVSLSRLWQGNGRSGEAYHLLQRAYYSSPDPARSLRELVQIGEELGETSNAIADQQRLLALPGQSTPENLEKLAALQAGNLQPSAATATWDSVIARFPRDPAALGHAADYFEGTDQLARASDLQRQIVALDPSDLARVLHLAALEAKTGDLAAARNTYESILAHTKPEPPGESLTLPDELKLPVDYAPVLSSGTGRFRLRAMLAGGPLPLPAAAASVKGDEGLRLEAIRALSRLLFPAEPAGQPNVPAQTTWLARWQQAADAGVRNEPLNAFYFAGSKTATMPLLAGWLAKGVVDESLVRGAFLTAGLHLGDYAKLGNWAWGDPDSGDHALRSAGLLGAVEQFLSTGGKPGPNFVGELFPPAANQPSVLWETAKQFADLHWYAQAAELGHHVLSLVRGGRAEYASGLAEWELYAGKITQARETLRTAVDEGGGTTFDVNASPVLSALREYYLLLPTTERRAFVADYLRRMEARGDKIHLTLAGVLLHSLEGDEAAAHCALDTLLATRLLATDDTGPSPNTRRWAFLLASGVQLEAWNLDSEAVYLWRRALDEATAFDQQFGAGEGTLVEIRRRLLGAEVSVAANPEEARAAVEAYLAGSPPTSVASGVAGEMLNNSRFAAAIEIDRYLCRVEPNDGEHWRNLFAAYEAAGDPDGLELALEQVCRSAGPFPEGLPRVDFVCRWAAAREHNGDAAGACRVLADEQAAHPGMLPILVQLAQTYERLGRWEEAAASWRETLPLDPTAVPILGEADAEEHLGHRERAIDILRGGLRIAGGGQAEVVTRLTRLYLAAGRTDEAHTLTNDLLRDGKLDALPALASAFVTADGLNFARELLAAAVLRTRDSSLRASLQQSLTSLYPVVNGDATAFLRQLGRLEVFAHDVPAYHGNWEAVKYKLARTVGADAWLETDLEHRWDHGKGDYLAGERLATLSLETQRDPLLARVIDEFDHRPLLPEQLLYSLEEELIRMGHPALALPLSERLYRRFPQNEQYALQRAVAWWKTGRSDLANPLLANVAATAVLRDDLTERVAEICFELGDKIQAQNYFEQAVRSDPLAAHSTDAFVQLARLYLEANRQSDAANLLQTAYRQDACTDFTPLVNFLASTGQLNGKNATEMPAPDFPLTFRRRALLLVAVSQRLTKDGRPEEARELLLRHPGFLAEVPATASALCQNLSPAQRRPVADALKVAASQRQPPYPQLVRTLESLQAQAVPSSALAVPTADH